MVSPIPTTPCGSFALTISNTGNSTVLSTSLESSGSVSSESTVATFRMSVPPGVPASTVTWKVMVALAPATKSNWSAVTFGAASVRVAPAADVSIKLPVTKVVLVGAKSVMLTLCASPVPLLVTVTV